MKISVVTVCFNAVDLIEGTIRSVVEQTYPDVEYIVIDGKSTDGTLDIIKRYSDGISYFVSEKDKGIYDAMNKGIAAATGDYIIFMNAGDKFTDKDVLGKVAPYLGKHTVVSGHWRRCYSNGKIKTAAPKELNSLKVEMPICHQATFIWLDYHKKNPFDTSFRLSADYNFFYNAWKNNKTFSYIDIDIVDFLEAEGASTNNISASVLERERAWRGEKGVFIRKFNLRYQICRIKFVKFLKSIISK